jgi:hypothetical protein
VAWHCQFQHTSQQYTKLADAPRGFSRVGADGLQPMPVAKLPVAKLPVAANNQRPAISGR